MKVLIMDLITKQCIHVLNFYNVPMKMYKNYVSFKNKIKINIIFKSLNWFQNQLSGSQPTTQWFWPPSLPIDYRWKRKQERWNLFLFLFLQLEQNSDCLEEQHKAPSMTAAAAALSHTTLAQGLLFLVSAVLWLALLFPRVNCDNSLIS